MATASAELASVQVQIVPSHANELALPRAEPERHAIERGQWVVCHGVEEDPCFLRSEPVTVRATLGLFFVNLIAGPKTIRTEPDRPPRQANRDPDRSSAEPG